MPIKSTSNCESTVIPMNAMQCSKLYQVVGDSYTGNVVMRVTDDVVINLSNVGELRRWTGKCSLKVAPMTAGSSVTLTQE
jgi:hypothetical protein